MRTAALVLFVASCLVFNIWMRLTDPRAESPDSSRSESGLAAGVILAGAASDYGWYNLRSDPPFVISIVDGFRIFIFENHPADLTLQRVIAELHARGASVIFISTGVHLTSDEASRLGQDVSTVLVFNRADRKTVAAMLPALRVELPQAMKASTSGPDYPPAEDEDDPGGAIIVLLALLVIGGLILRHGWRWMRATIQHRNGRN